MFGRVIVAGFVVAVTSVVSAMPASAAALATDWKTVSAGGSHACAIRSVGKLYCWGSDGDGRVGNGTTTGGVNSPVQITAATDWNTVSAGGSHTCAIRSVGKLYCWGDDENGQVGNGAGGSTDAPTQITTATDWKSVSAGSGHTCAIRSIGKLYCWGDDFSGEIGNGAATEPVTSPKQITAATDWKAVSAGVSHTCAVRGKLYCWGDDADGQVGNGAATEPVTSPKQITAATDWKTAAAGYRHACAIRSIGKLYCWGYDFDGQVGNGAEADNVLSPQQV